jgi:bifunctional non-homologous end joining protein LigD
VKPRRSTHRSSARFIARTLDGAVQAPFPGFIEPCNPTLRKVPPAGEGWLHEIKHDGYRVQAHFDGEPRIYTRRGNEWAARMPTIAAVASWSRDCTSGRISVAPTNSTAIS